MRIVVVAGLDSQEPIARLLKDAGYSVLSVLDPKTAERHLTKNAPAVVVVRTGPFPAEEMSRLRLAADSRRVPLLVVEQTLEIDDLPEAIERVAAGGTPEPDGRATVGSGSAVSVGGLDIDPVRHSASLFGRPLDLTPKEFELLTHFVRHPARVWSRQQLFEAVWGYDYGDMRLVTVHLNNLRKKLRAEASGLEMIETVRRVGYRLASTLPVARPGTGEAGPAAMPRHRHAAPPFVGRDSEMHTLAGVLAAVRQGQVGAVAVAGEAGIGKTRLAEEFELQAAAAGVATYWATCRRSSVAPLYELWTAQIAGGERPHAPPGAPSAPALYAGPGLHPDDKVFARRHRLERLGRAVRERAESGVFCLFLDDLQESDQSSLLALRHAVQTLRDLPLMIVVTYRPSPTSSTGPVADLLADLVRLHDASVLTLGPLSGPDIAHLVQQAGFEQESDRLAAAVHQKTDGNPFLVAQLLRLMSARPGLCAADLEALHLGSSEGVKQIVNTQLSEVSAACRRILELAATFGTEFRVPELAEAAGVPGPEAAESLYEAMLAGLVRPRDDDPDRWAFTHGLFQEIIHAETPPAEHARLHARVAESLERAHGEASDLWAGELARHCWAAAGLGFAEKAAHFSFEAARAAMSRYGWEDARDHWRRGLETLSLLPSGSPMRDPGYVAGIYEQLGETLGFTADLSGAIDAYEQAFQRLPPAERIRGARLRRKQGAEFAWRAHPLKAAVALAEAEALLGAAPAVTDDREWLEEWLEIRLASADCLFQMGETDRLERAAKELEQAVSRSGNPLHKARYEDLLVSCLWQTQRLVLDDDALEVARRCSASYRAIGSPACLLLAEQVLAMSLLASVSERERSRGLLAHYLRLAEEYRHPVHELEALGGLTMWHRLHGDAGKVAEYAERSVAIAQESQQTVRYVAHARGNLSWVAWRKGDHRRAAELADAGLSELEETDARSPLEWQVRWTVLGLGASKADHDAVARQAGAILDPSQQRMPQEVEEQLLRLCGPSVPAGREWTSAAERLLTVASGHGYL